MENQHTINGIDKTVQKTIAPEIDHDNLMDYVSTKNDPSTSRRWSVALVHIMASPKYSLPLHWLPRRYSSVYTPTSYISPPGFYGPFQRAPLEDNQPIFRHDGEDGYGLPAFSSQSEIIAYASTRSRRSERCQELKCTVLGLHFHSRPMDYVPRTGQGEDNGYRVIPDSEKAMTMTREALLKRTIANKVRRARRQSSMLNSSMRSTGDMHRALPPPPRSRLEAPSLPEPRMPQRQMTLTIRSSPAPGHR